MEIVEAKGTVSDVQHALEEAEKEFIDSKLQRVHDQLKAQIETYTHNRVAMSRMFEKDLATLMFVVQLQCKVFKMLYSSTSVY